MITPTVVFGLPLYNQVAFLAETLESLLAQSYPNFAIIVVDDSTHAGPRTIVEHYAKLDERLTYQPNPRRLGLVGNWRKAFELARERYPACPYFAWASDHDLWHPHWLGAMVEAMDDPSVVLAYPFVTYLSDHRSDERGKLDAQADTVGIRSRAARLRRAALHTEAGNAVYGLFRAAALERAGVFRPVIAPDRLLMAELSLCGSFKVVPRYLWLRRRTLPVDYARQRTTLFGGPPPISAYLPWPIVHAWVLASELARRSAESKMSRSEAVVLCASYFLYMLGRVVHRQLRQPRKWRQRTLRAWRRSRIRILRRQP